MTARLRSVWRPFAGDARRSGGGARGVGARLLALGVVVGLLAVAAGRAEAGPGWALAWRFPAETLPPFSQVELASAVTIRQPAGALAAEGAGGDPAEVAIGWAEKGVVQASTAGRRRVVVLGAARGEEAARLVALAVVDVLRPLELPPVAAGAGQADLRGGDAGGDDHAGRLGDDGAGGDAEGGGSGQGARRLGSEGAGRGGDGGGGGRGFGDGTLMFGLAGVVNRGATSAGLALEPTALVAWQLAGDAGATQVGLLGELGYGQGRGLVGTGNLVPQTLVVHMAPLRLGLFLRRGGWTLSMGGLARGYRTVGVAGGAVRSVQGVLLGGQVGAQRAFALGRGFGLLVAGGVDVVANAVDFRVGGHSLLRTGRVVPAVRMGLLWRAR